MKNIKLIILILFLTIFLSPNMANAIDPFSAVNTIYNVTNSIQQPTKTYQQPAYQQQAYPQQYQQPIYPQQTYQQQQAYPQQYQQPVYQQQQSYPQQYQQQIPAQVNNNPYQFSNIQQYQGAAQTLKDLPPGTIVIDPNSLWKYNYKVNYMGDVNVNAPVFWQIFENNHYKPNSTLLVSRYFVGRYDFCHKQKKLTAWKDSDVRRWLRTTFYNHLTPEFKNAIVNIEAPSIDLLNKPYKSIENIFLLSITEWGLSDRTNNGQVINYPYLQRELTAGTVEYYDVKGLLKLEDNAAMGYGTRTINIPRVSGFGEIGRTDYFKIINGLLETEKYDYGFANYVRPAVNLKSNTPVDGPYSMTYFPNQSLTYYVLKLPKQTTGK